MEDIIKKFKDLPIIKLISISKIIKKTSNYCT